MMDTGFAPTPVRVAVDGQPLTPEGAAALRSVMVEARASCPAHAVLVFEATPTALPALAGAKGSALTLSAAGETLFEGRVSAVARRVSAEGVMALTLRAHDALMALHRVTEPRRYAAAGLDALTREILGRHGLSLSAGSGAPCPSVLIQHGESDLAFLARQAARLGWYLRAAGREVALFPAEGLGPRRTLDFGDGLRDAEWEESDLPALSEHETERWDMLADRALSGRAPGGGAGGREARGLLPHQDPVAAERLSEARAAQRRGAAGRLTGLTDGAPTLRPGTPVRLSLGPSAPVEATLSAVVHRIEPGTGFLTEFQSGLAPPAERPGLCLAYGEVIEVDARHAARLRLRLPALSGLESDWMQTVIPAAGTGKGAVALAEVGDRVAALLFEENPAQGIALGGLFGAEATPRLRPRGDGTRPFVTRTARGQQMTLDDRSGLAELRSRSGTRLSLQAAATLHAAGDLLIEAPGKTITIRAARVDFESG